MPRLLLPTYLVLGILVIYVGFLTTLTLLPDPHVGSVETVEMVERRGEEAMKGVDEGSEMGKELEEGGGREPTKTQTKVTTTDGSMMIPGRTRPALPHPSLPHPSLSTPGGAKPLFTSKHHHSSTDSSPHLPSPACPPSSPRYRVGPRKDHQGSIADGLKSLGLCEEEVDKGVDFWWDMTFDAVERDTGVGEGEFVWRWCGWWRLVSCLRRKKPNKQTREYSNPCDGP